MTAGVERVMRAVARAHRAKVLKPVLRRETEWGAPLR